MIDWLTTVTGLQRTHLFPVLLIILQLSASAVYFVDGNVRLCIYWSAAAVLAIVVTF